MFFHFFSWSWSELTNIQLNRVRVNEAKLYIDDIFFMLFGSSNIESIQTALTNIFQNNGLTLTFPEVNNKQTGQGVEFLDVRKRR